MPSAALYVQLDALSQPSAAYDLLVPRIRTTTVVGLLHILAVASFRVLLSVSDPHVPPIVPFRVHFSMDLQVRGRPC